MKKLHWYAIWDHDSEESGRIRASSPPTAAIAHIKQMEAFNPDSTIWSYNFSVTRLYPDPSKTAVAPGVGVEYLD